MTSSRATPSPAAGAAPTPVEPTRIEIDDLICRAREHPLGTDFLLEGALDAVAAIFGVHAFVVDAARDVLGHGEIVEISSSTREPVQA